MPNPQSAAAGDPADEAKRFQNLRAAFALRGPALHRSDPADGPVRLWAERWGHARPLADLNEAAAFLRQLGGAGR